jgi:hypothetical protein
MMVHNADVMASRLMKTQASSCIKLIMDTFLAYLACSSVVECCVRCSLLYLIYKSVVLQTSGFS